LTFGGRLITLARSSRVAVRSIGRCPSIPKSAQSGLFSQPANAVHHVQCWRASTTEASSKATEADDLAKDAPTDSNDAEIKDDAASVTTEEEVPPPPFDWPIIYQSRIGDLITRLKIVSITSCVVSIVGLPIAMALKNGDLPSAKQVGMGSVAFVGATGSTCALHFVFGPYILNMEEIPVRQCHYDGKGEDESDDDDGKVNVEGMPMTSTKVSADDVEPLVSADSRSAAAADDDDAAATAKANSCNHYMIKATTRSVFGWKKEVVFDPATDITPYKGTRPFANFVAKDVVLYAHPEMLDDKLRQQLLYPKGTIEENKQSGGTNEGIPTSSKTAVKDDDLF